MNFKRLAQAAGGPDALGSLLDLTTGRLKALEEGYEFTSETAFYIELELGLPAGWFDQKDAPLPAEIKRKADFDEDHLGSTPPTESRSQPAQPEPLIKTTKPVAAHPPEVTPSQAPRTPKVHRVPKPQPQENIKVAAVSADQRNMEIAPMPTVVDSVHTARELRRKNLVVLTQWPKSKTGLARLLQKTPANISHLIHGEKNFDREAAKEIELVTGLPEGWFEKERSAASVPENVKALLTSAPGSVPAPVVNLAPRKRGRPSLEESRQAETAAAAPTSARKPRSTNEVKPDSAPLKGKATTAARSVTPPPETAIALPVGPVMSEATRKILRENEGLMGAVAEALVKTIIEKSRSGALSEKAAYKMLSEVIDV